MQSGLLGFIGVRQQAIVATMASDLDLLLGGAGTHAYCLACPRQARARDMQTGAQWLARLEAILTN